MSTARRLIINASLPEYATPAERIATVDRDVRELMATMKASLEAKAHAYTIGGWELDDESWEAVVSKRTVILSVVLRRPA